MSDKTYKTDRRLLLSCYIYVILTIILGTILLEATRIPFHPPASCSVVLELVRNIEYIGSECVPGPILGQQSTSEYDKFEIASFCEALQFKHIGSQLRCDKELSIRTLSLGASLDSRSFYCLPGQSIDHETALVSKELNNPIEIALFGSDHFVQHVPLWTMCGNILNSPWWGHVVGVLLFVLLLFCTFYFGSAAVRVWFAYRRRMSTHAASRSHKMYDYCQWPWSCVQINNDGKDVPGNACGLFALFFNRPWRFTLYCLFLLVCVLGMLAAIRFWLFPGPYSVSFDSASVRVSSLDGDKALFALLPSQGWANTEIHVSDGQTLKFSVSGGFNTAVHHLVESGLYDYRPSTAWVFRPGSYSEQRSHLAASRASGMMLKGQSQGSVLAHICCDGDVCPDIRLPETIKEIHKRQLDNPNTIQVAVAAEQLSGRNTLPTRCSGFLYLAVNENYPLDRSSYVMSRSFYLNNGENESKKLQSSPGFLWASMHGWILETLTFITVCPELLEYCALSLGGDDEGDFLSNEPFKKCASKLNSGRYLNGVDSISFLRMALSGVFLFDFNDKQAFLFNDEIVFEKLISTLMYIRDAMRWELGVDGYPWLWYDDNAGVYLVSIEIK